MSHESVKVYISLLLLVLAVLVCGLLPAIGSFSPFSSVVLRVQQVATAAPSFMMSLLLRLSRYRITICRLTL